MDGASARRAESEARSAFTSLDAAASRLRLYASTFMAVGALIGAGSLLAVRHITASVRMEQVELRRELHAFTDASRLKATVDSLRFERVMGVVELAVVALVEPEGSVAQRSAVAELRARRQVIPRQ